MQNKQVIGYDETKKMLNTLRKINESKETNSSLSEQSIGFTGPSQSQRIGQSDVPSNNQTDVTQNLKDNVDVINDVDVRLLSSDEADIKLMDEERNGISSLIDNFRSQVSQLTEFEPGFTISPEQIRMDGSIPDLDINFVFIAGEEAGLYINADMLMVHAEVMEMFNKLFKFEQSFKDAMEPMIRKRKTN